VLGVALTTTKMTRRCTRGCPFNYDPRCASDGNTYDNECLMEIAQCESNGKLEIVKLAPCGTLPSHVLIF